MSMDVMLGPTSNAHAKSTLSKLEHRELLADAANLKRSGHRSTSPEGPMDHIYPGGRFFGTSNDDISEVNILKQYGIVT